MSVLDDEVAKEPPSRGGMCRICIWYDKLEPDVKESFDRHVASGIEKARLHRACMRLTPPVDCAYATFSRHVRECLR